MRSKTRTCGSVLWHIPKPSSDAPETPTPRLIRVRSAFTIILAGAGGIEYKKLRDPSGDITMERPYGACFDRTLDL